MSAAIKDVNALYSDYISSLNTHSKCLENHVEKIRDHYLLNKVYVETNIQSYCIPERENVLVARSNYKQANNKTN